MAGITPKDKNRVCPVELAGGLDNTIRRWLQNPKKIVGPYVHEGMTVIDIGCGPGFFTVPMAAMVGPSGRVYACDLQDGMLDRLKAKIRGSELEGRITPHKTGADTIGVKERADFILVFYMLHEVLDKGGFFREIKSLLKENGKALIVEPNFHVSRDEFKESMVKAGKAGFNIMEGPKVFMSRSGVLTA
ncbi:MAG TPA: class I SAM-dependent methyltransferase [Chitinivibrionales bacterium]|nr:class I SAM-dependent methyltransferase [Chitinivibrionales bacterium]